MARKIILENLMKLAQGIGANPSKFMGTKTNISFLGKGPTSNILFQSPVRIKSYLRNRGSEEVVLGQINDAMGFATAGKLNPIQLEILNDNLDVLGITPDRANESKAQIFYLPNKVPV